MEFKKIDQKTWLLKTPLEHFFTFTNLKDWKGIIKRPFNTHLQKATCVGDLLEMWTRDYNVSHGVGVVRWKKLMHAFYNFGIKDCFDYPIATDPQRYRITRKYIDLCKKEICV